MTTITRLAAATTLTAGLGLGLAAPASAAPAPAPAQGPCQLLGGTAYPPGACTFNLNPQFQIAGISFRVPITIVTQGTSVSVKIGQLPPFTIVFGYLIGQPGPPVQATADADGVVELAVPTDGVAPGEQQLTVAAAPAGAAAPTEAPGTTPAPASGAGAPAAAGSSMVVPLTVVSPDDPEGVAAAEAAAASGDTAVTGTADVRSDAVVPASFEEVGAAGVPSTDHTGAYVLAGGVLLGGVALAGTAVHRRRES